MTDGTTRLAFVGQATYFAPCAVEGRAGSLEACFIDFRKGADTTTLVRQLERVAPDVVVVFKPETIPSGLLAGLEATTVGYLTEPLPGLQDNETTPHPDLARRLENLRSIDGSNFDRIVIYNSDALIPADLGIVPWRTLPLPIADRYFREVESTSRFRRPLFIGRSTPHREQILTPAKHAFDILHIAHGVGPDDLVQLLAATDVGINVHNENYPNFENRAILHLASGHILISERLQPMYGLEPGLDYVELADAGHLVSVLHEIRRAPEIFRRVRLRGRMKAELFRASKVYQELVDDLHRDLAVFGTGRAGPGRTSHGASQATR
jgi:hypothetical protein